MSTNSSKKRPAEAVDGKFAKAGRAKAMRTGRESAWRCFHRFEETRDNDLMAKLKKTDDDEVKDEIIQNSLIAFADYMASNPIPQQISTGKILGKDGCKQYLGQVKEMIKDQTSHLQVWNRHEELRCFTLRESLGAGNKRELITGNWEFKDPSSRALPIRATDSDLRQCE
jgi:hypothetical protein